MLYFFSRFFKLSQICFFLFFSSVVYADYTNYEDNYKIKSHSYKAHHEAYKVKKFEFTKKSKTNPSVDLKYKAYFFESLHVEDLLPKGILRESKQLQKVYKNLELRDILFISLQAPFEVHSSSTYGQTYTTIVTKDDIPKEILKELPLWQDMKVSATIDRDGTTYGGNFRGYFSQERNKEFKEIFKKLGIKIAPFVISGSSKKFDPFLVVESGKVQKMKYGEKIKERGSDVDKKYIKSLGIIMDIPQLRLPLLDKFMKLENIAIGIKSGLYEMEPWKSLPKSFKEKKTKSDMDIYLSAQSTLQIESYTHKGAVLLDLQTGEEQDAFTMMSFNKNEDVFEKLKVKKLKFLKKMDISSTAAYKIEILQNKQDQSKDNISLSAVGKVDVDSKEVDMTAKFEINNEGVFLDFVDIHDTFTLADFSNKIPKADEFALSEVKVYPPFNPKVEPGIEAKSKFFDIETDVFLFEHKDNDIFALDVSAKGDKSFNLAHLTKRVKNGVIPQKVSSHLKGFGVANGAVIFSEEEINIDFSSLKDGIAKDLFTEIFGKRTSPLKLYKITFLSDFDVSIAGDIGAIMKNGTSGVKMGLSDSTYILGSVEGIFGKAPFKLDLEFKGDEEYDASALKLPSAFKKLKASSNEGIFLKVVDGSAEVALSTGFGFSVNGSMIEFDGSLGVDINEDDLGLSLTGSTEDDIDNFAGIKHFKVTGAKLNAVIGNDIKVGLEIDTSFLGRSMTTSSDLVFAPKGYPKGLGFKTYASKLDKDGWKLVNYSTILTTPTIAIGGLGALAGGGTLGIIGAIVANPEGDAGGAAAGAPFGGVGAAPGAVVGGLVSSGLVGGAGVAVGAIAGGVAGAAGGFAIGTLGDAIVGNTKLGKEGMDKLTSLEANIFQAEDVYLSFATENAASADLSIPKGIHFNMENVQFFDGVKKNHRPDFTGIYALANKITQDVDKVEKFLKKMRDDFKNAEKRFAKKVKEKEAEYKKKYKKNWKEELHKDVLKTFEFTKEELDKAKKYAKILTKIYKKVMAVVHYELGLVKEAPKGVEYKLTSELKTSIKHLKEFMNGAHVKDESFGPIKIAKAQIDLVPSFVASTQVKLFDKFDEQIEIKFNKDNKLMFESDFEVDTFGKIENEFILQSKDEVEVLGRFPSTVKFEKWLETKISRDATLLLKDSLGVFNQLEKDIKALENDIKDISNKIENEAKKEVTYIENSKEVQYAKKAWQKAERDYRSAIDKCKSYKTCLYHGHLCSHPCDDAYKLISGSVDRIVSVVNHYGGKLHIGHITNPHHKEQTYKDAKKNVDVSTFNAKKEEYKSDKAEKLSEQNSKKQQRENLGGKNVLSFINKIKAALSTTDIAKEFSIQELSFAGILKPLNPADTMYLMEIKYKLFGKSNTDYVLFKPFDIKFNEASFAMFSVKTFEKILNNMNIDKKYKKTALWIVSNVDKQISNVQSFMEKHISKKDEKRFEKAINSFINGRKNISSVSKEYDKQLLASYKRVTPIDLMAPSKSFSHRYIAVAHSTLCLSVASNGLDVLQKNCKDIKSERWDAVNILDEGKKPTGYVQLKTNGLCLKAATKDNKDSGLPLKLSQCKQGDIHEQWKILSKDGVFDRIVNRYSQKCLHFDTVNTNPRTAYAVWRSCLAIDSQGFRDIKDAQRPSWYNVEKMIQAQSGSCLSTKKSFDDYFKKTKKGHFTATKEIFERMKQRKDDILIADKCEKGVENEFNFLELINGDIKLVHAQTGWCVAPKSKHSDEVSLKPCNKGDYMFWDPIEVGGAVILKNKETNRCLSLDNLQNRPFHGAKLENCTKSQSQKIDFLKTGR